MPHPINDHCVYRAFDFLEGDEHPRLLYVGMTNSLIARFDAHRRLAPWYPGATLLLVHEGLTRAEAQIVEAHAIRSERPLHNRSTEAQHLEAKLIAGIGRTFDLWRTVDGGWIKMGGAQHG